MESIYVWTEVLLTRFKLRFEAMNLSAGTHVGYLNSPNAGCRLATGPSRALIISVNKTFFEIEARDGVV
jgi:hypothetical protein